MKAQIEGHCKGYFLVGENPAVGSANGKMQRLGLANLDWLVVRDLQMIESATFWKDGPEIETGELVTEEIGTEIFFLPAAAHTEKAGTFTQTQRMLQWRDKAIDPPGDCPASCRSTSSSATGSARSCATPTDETDRPLLDLAWDYPVDEPGRARQRAAVLREINGTGPDGAPLSAYTELKADGSTVVRLLDLLRGVRRRGQPGAAPQARTGSRTSSPPSGAGPGRPTAGSSTTARRPRPTARRGASARSTSGGTPRPGSGPARTCPTSSPDRAPDHVPEPGAKGPDAIGGHDPFVMQTDGKAWLFAPLGVADGPMPTHYEPPESPVAQPALPPAEQPVAASARRRSPTRSTRA